MEQVLQPGQNHPTGSPLNQANRRALVLNLLLIVGGVLAVNGLIFGLGWGQGTAAVPTVRVSLQPPDYVIGIVWTVLFVFLAVARFLLNAPASDTENGQRAVRARRWIGFLIVFCLVYPLYTLAPNSEISGIIGNIATIALTVFVVRRTLLVQRNAALLIAPVALWVSFATFLTLRQIGLLS